MSSLRLVFLLPSIELGSRDPVAVEPPPEPGNGQDPAGDPETPEAEAAPVSIAKTRDASSSNLCSRSLNLLLMTPSALPKVLMLGSIFAIHCCMPLMAAKRSSIVLPDSGGALYVRPIVSRSGAEPSGEPKFEEIGCNGEPGKGLCIGSSLDRAVAMKTDGKHRSRVVDTWTRQNQKSS